MQRIKKQVSTLIAFSLVALFLATSTTPLYSASTSSKAAGQEQEKQDLTRPASTMMVLFICGIHGGQFISDVNRVCIGGTSSKAYRVPGNVLD